MCHYLKDIWDYYFGLQSDKIVDGEVFYMGSMAYKDLVWINDNLTGDRKSKKGVLGVLYFMHHFGYSKTREIEPVARVNGNLNRLSKIFKDGLMK